MREVAEQEGQGHSHSNNNISDGRQSEKKSRMMDSLAKTKVAHAPTAPALTAAQKEFIAQNNTKQQGATQLQKPCNCRNSRCLKLYCECFASGIYCSPERCNCNPCQNNSLFEAIRQNAVTATLEKTPNAFRPKINTQLTKKGQKVPQQNASQVTPEETNQGSDA